MVDLPTGTVTFLFTDIVGSTQLLHELGPGYDAVFTAHRKLLRAAFEAYHGHEVDTQGDAFFVAFQRASDALACAVAAQQALAAYPWPDGHPIEVRMGLHIGEPRIVEDHYVGVDVHRAARVAAAGHGGQIVLSQAVYGLAAGALPPGTSVRDLGRHRSDRAARSSAPAPAAPRRGTGFLTIDSDPWTEVYLGTTRLGVTPLSGVRLPSGGHELELRNAGAGIRQRLKVVIRPGLTTRVHPSL